LIARHHLLARFLGILVIVTVAAVGIGAGFMLPRNTGSAAAPSAALPQDAVIADVLAVVGVVQKK